MNLSTPTTVARPWWLRLMPVALVFAGVGVYLNSLPAQFVFDDDPWIVNNPDLRRVWPPWVWFANTPRPVLKASLILNFAADRFLSPRLSPKGELDEDSIRNGYHVEGYHLFNIAVHVLAGLTLFGIVRRTLLRVSGPAGVAGAESGRVRSADHGGQETTRWSAQRTLPVSGGQPQAPARFRSSPAAPWFTVTSAAWLAFVIALIWIVHPLQTQAVTYTIQRSESMAALCYLLVLYAVIRMVESRRPWMWGAAAVLASAVGLGAKEIVVTAPVVLLLYDRAFLAGSFLRALKQRWWLYVALLATWGVVPLAMWSAQVGGGPPSAGFELPLLTPWNFAVTQAGVILYYLRLGFWPHPLVLDYIWQMCEPWLEAPWLPVPLALIVQCLLVLLLLGATLVALWRWPRIGFVAAGFFVVLAPTSSVFPIADLMIEHRMYLPLAAVVTLLVLAGYAVGWRGPRKGPSSAHAALRMGCVLAVVAVVAALSVRTILRNQDYRTAVSLWKSVLRYRPLNPRAWHNLGSANYDLNRLRDALECYRQSLRLAPDYPDSQDSLIRVLADLRRFDEAEQRLDHALKQRPKEARLHCNYGLLLVARGQIDQAVPWLEKAIALRRAEGRGYPLAHSTLGTCLYQQGRPDKAMEHLRTAIAQEPELIEARNNLASVLLAQGQPEQAVAEYRQALAILPAHTTVLKNLGRALIELGRYGEAQEQFERALRVVDDCDPDALSGLGLALQKQGRYELALRAFGEALDLRPNWPEDLRRVAWLRATCPQAGFRNGALALQLAEQAAKRAAELTAKGVGDHGPAFQQTLAAALAEVGRYDDAAAAARRAGEQAAAQKNGKPLPGLDEQIARYQARQPWREAPGGKP